MRKFIATLLLVFVIIRQTNAQEFFSIKQYVVAVKVNKDASLDIDETINVHFHERRHGIYRLIPYRYRLQSLPEEIENADRQLEWGGYANTIIENIRVDGWKYEVSTSGDYKSIKIGSADKYVDGDQQYKIYYRVLNALNFFKDHSELYFNIIGDQWEAPIDSVNFSIQLYNSLAEEPSYFVVTGSAGSTENNTLTRWNDNKILSGHSVKHLNNKEGVTIGIVFPKDFLVQQNYSLRGIYWLILPLIVFAGMFLLWKRWGKDEKPTIQTEFYPPENLSPGICGYIIDNKLNRRDLTALVPYWGAGGYLQIKETEENSLFGMIKHKEYEFIKLKELAPEAMGFEKTLFNGIFKSGNNVKLSELKNVLYTTMSAAKRELETEVDKSAYYEKGSRGMGCVFMLASIVLIIYGVIVLGVEWIENLWYPIALISSGVITLCFGIFMSKKTKKGTELYRKLAGFKEFIQAVEKDRLQEFLKQDEHYFDKVLPYAIVFNVADKWKDKLKGLDIPPPNWYSGNYTNFNTHQFMNRLDHSMNEMSKNFYSSPSSSGSSGGSFRSSGGSSGGGFGGGGGSSW